MVIYSLFRASPDVADSLLQTLARQLGLVHLACNHMYSQGEFNVVKRRGPQPSLDVNTDPIDGSWARAKMAIPTSMHTLTSNGEVNPQIFKCLPRYCWRWENTSKDLMLCARNAVSNIVRR